MKQAGWIRSWLGLILVVSSGGATPLLLRAGDAAPPAFAGWQQLHVLKQEGFPDRLRVADLQERRSDSDPRNLRQDLLLVNARHARLEILRWVPPAERKSRTERQAGTAVNELAIPIEFQRVEVPIGQVPVDVAVLPSTGDGRPSLLVLVNNPSRLLRLEWQDERWQQTGSVDLLPGRWSGNDALMRVWPEPLADGGHRVLLSTDEGLQVVDYDAAGTPHGRARWLEPRESGARQNWWTLDLDGDGHTDLIEWTGTQGRAVRWYRGSATGLLPVQTLHGPQVAGVQRLRSTGGEELLILEATPPGVVRRYALEKGESSPLGREFPLSLPGGEAAVWALADLAGQLTLVVADPAQPRLMLFTFDPEQGWRPGESYPSVGRIQQMVAAGPDELLLWTAEGSDLYQTRWEQGRLAFPQPLSSAETGGGERLVLGLGRLGTTCWSVHRNGEDLWLHLREMGASETRRQPFPAAAGKVEKAIWLGGEQLLVADKFARGLRLVRLAGEQATSLEPGHLSRARLEEFRLYEDPRHRGQTRVARLLDGVLQWLDTDLQPTDQVMLPDGQRLAGFAWDPNMAEDQPLVGWALVQGGASISRLEADAGGVLRETDRFPVEEGRSLLVEARLGLMLGRASGISVLSEGAPWQLSVRQQLDPRSSRPAGAGETQVHRIETLDLLGRGHDDALLLDFAQHRLTVFSDQVASEETPDDLGPLISWLVFEDSAYPYGGGGDRQVREPRSVMALDIDGDGQRDLAMLSHDRLLIYLAREHAVQASADASVDVLTSEGASQ